MLKRYLKIPVVVISTIVVTTGLFIGVIALANLANSGLVNQVFNGTYTGDTTFTGQATFKIDDATGNIVTMQEDGGNSVWEFLHGGSNANVIEVHNDSGTKIGDWGTVGGAIRLISETGIDINITAQGAGDLNLTGTDVNILSPVTINKDFADEDAALLIKDNSVTKFSLINGAGADNRLVLHWTDGTEVSRYTTLSDGAQIRTLTGNNLYLTVASGSELIQDAAVKYSSGTIAIASGALAIVGNTYVVMQAETGTTDVLDTISGMEQGDIIYLESDSTDTITVDCVSPAGNIVCPASASDCVIAPYEQLHGMSNANGQLVILSACGVI